MNNAERKIQISTGGLTYTYIEEVLNLFEDGVVKVADNNHPSSVNSLKIVVTRHTPVNGSAQGKNPRYLCELILSNETIVLSPSQLVLFLNSLIGFLMHHKFTLTKSQTLFFTDTYGVDKEVMVCYDSDDKAILFDEVTFYKVQHQQMCQEKYQTLISYELQRLANFTSS